LVAACIAGDGEAWLQFKRQYERLIRATAARVSRLDDTRLDDVEATVYQKLLEDRCRRMRAWKGRARFSTYLVQVTRNLVLDWVAMEQRRVAAPLDDAPEPAADAHDHEAEEVYAEQVTALGEALEALPEKQAIIMRLRLKGHSLREIAQLLNRPVGTVSVENSRAMARLRKRLAHLQAC
jgi:RNA polymerase sigma-70 factor (ECF subfamily)